MNRGKWVLWLLVVVLIAAAGCQESLRFAPKEEQKQTAWLTAELARDVESKGVIAGSPIAKKIVAGTRAAAFYIGQPKVPADISQFDTVSSTAQVQAQDRPDPWTYANSALELGIGLSALLGGVYGTKAVKYLTLARQKTKALQEIVQNNELFKLTLADREKDNFKIAQSQQTPATKKLVAEIKVDNPVKSPPISQPVAS